MASSASDGMARELVAAARGNALGEVTQLLNQGADPNAAADFTGKGNVTPLGAAAYNGHTMVVQMLLR